MSHGYGAGYCGYGWSNVYAVDCFTLFDLDAYKEEQHDSDKYD